MGCGNSKYYNGEIPALSDQFLRAQPALSHGNLGSFPPIMNLYFTGCKKITKGYYFMLNSVHDGGEEHLYAVKYHLGNTETSRCVTLFSGTDRKTAIPLGTAGVDKPFAPFAFISLPHPTDTEPSNSAMNHVEMLRWPKGFETMYFDLPVGSAPQQTERFEWRGERMMLASTKKAKPWNLVRIRGGIGEPEVVATWTGSNNKRLIDGKMGTFEFKGSGRTGELGQYWTLMSVMTLLYLVQCREAAAGLRSKGFWESILD